MADREELSTGIPRNGKLKKMERVTVKQKAEFFYLKIKLEFSEGDGLPPVVMDALTLKIVLIQALQSLHGQTCEHLTKREVAWSRVGTAICIDILKYEADSMEAILRVRERGLVKCWSALTFFSFYQGRQCAFRVLQVSPHLLSLAANSRQWNIHDAVLR